jgi:hypothetical protein
MIRVMTSCTLILSDMDDGFDDGPMGDGFPGRKYSYSGCPRR